MSGEVEARNALLDYFSSRASAHATQLLTLAIVGLTIVGVWPHAATLFKSIVFAASLAAVLVSGLWLAGRMVYWSYLSHTIISVRALPRRDIPDIERLHNRAVDVVREQYPKWALFSSLTTTRLLALAAIWAAIWAVALMIELHLSGCLA